MCIHMARASYKAILRVLTLHMSPPDRCQIIEHGMAINDPVLLCGLGVIVHAEIAAA